MTYITLNLTRDVLEEGKVTAYTATSMSMDVLISWSQDVIEVIEKASKGETCRLLYDLSHPGVSMQFLVLTNREVYKPGFTPLGYAKVQQFLQKNPQFRIKLAVVFSNKSTGELASKYAKDLDNPGIRHKLFFNREKALEWLTAQDRTIPQAIKPTRQIDLNSAYHVLLRDSQDGQQFADRKKVALRVDESVEYIPLEEDLSVILGRGILEGYGTKANTVSRKHVRLHIEYGYLYITDLDSTNGTYINGERLEPMKPYILKADDHLNLGALSVEVIFRDG